MILPILNYPDKRLRTQAKSVNKIDAQIKTLVADMFATMYARPGIGLAATQVDQHVRVIVIDISKNQDEPLCLINPTIITKSGTDIQEEGCLSLPDYFAKVQRFAVIKVQALDVNGKQFELEADKLLSVCIQHEIDHLRGVLFVDYLSKLKQKRILDKFNKLQK